ncbi:unnamed protein product, partial [Amoebophrya sp. A120]
NKNPGLSPASRELYAMLPADCRQALLFRDDVRGEPLLPQVDAEKLLARLVREALSHDWAEFIPR